MPAEFSDNPFDQGYYDSSDLSTMGFRAVGCNVRIAKNCTIIGLNNISLGDNVRIDANVVIACASGDLIVGNYVHIGAGSHLACVGGIKFDDFSNTSQGVKIYSGTDDYHGLTLTNPMVPQEYRGMELAPVLIGKHVIIGSGTVILQGVTLPIGASVGAMSLVTRSLEPWTVNAGIPARFIKARSMDLLRYEELIRQKSAESNS
jgi:acetyltransferase-like isoleucine patch superfamily enzyme